jgi:hypothetical protein
MACFFLLLKMKTSIFKNYLQFDLRALALMRMGIASVIMLDLLIRLTDLEAFYTNRGAVPLNLLFENNWNQYYFSIHTISGLWQVQFILFMLSFFCAIMLFIGYRTKLFTFFSWVMMLSLHNRNGLILQGGDDLLRMVLFWGMFLPWGNRYSCDSLQYNLKEETTPLFDAACFAYLLQICYIYTGSALLKGAEWNTSYTALYYTYSLDQIAYPLTKYIYYNGELLKSLTFLAYYFELLVPILFFIPIKNYLFRTVGVISIIIFHFFNSITLLIGLFPLIGIVTVIGLLPTEVMDKFDRAIIKIKERVTLAFLSFGYVLSYLIKWKKPVTNYISVGYKIRTAVLIFLIFFVFDWNFSNLEFTDNKLSNNLRFIGYSLRLDQSWGMFAPGVFKEDGWYVLEGTTKNNEHIDLLQPNKKISYNKPPSVVSMFKNDRWRKYSENFIFPENENIRGYFADYTSRTWNENHPDKKINLLQIIYMEELTLSDYKYSVPKKNILWEYKLE